MHDLIIEFFFNCEILTVDQNDSRAEAMAIFQENIIAIGTKECVQSEIKQFIEDYKTEFNQDVQVREMDVVGSCIVPGFIDAHMHPGLYVYFKTQLDLFNVKSYADLGNRLKIEDEALESTKWIIGINLIENTFEDPSERRFPTKQDLDGFVPDRPIAIFRHDGHIGAVNSLVLGMMGIDRNNVSEKILESGEIRVDEEGDPTGVFTEGALSYVMGIIPLPAIEDLKEASKKMSSELAKFGITTCGGIIQSGEIGPAGKAGAMELPLVQALIKEGWIKQDFVFYVITDKPKTLQRLQKIFLNLSKNGNRFVIGGIKIFADGTFGALSAYLFEPFADSIGENYGFMVNKREELYRLAKETAALGFQVACHTIGDKANQIVVNVYQEVLKGSTKREPHLRIEHASQLTAEIIRDAAALGIVMVCQPAFLDSEYTWLKKRLGPERTKYTYPFRSIIDAGILLAGASDAPIESADVLKGLHACVTRNGFVPEEAITIAEALRMFTYSAARALGQESIKGSLEKGKLADFVILNQNPESVPPEELTKIIIFATYHRGFSIYRYLEG